MKQNDFKAKTDFSHTALVELQYADDGTNIAHTEKDLQCMLNGSVWANLHIGVTLKKIKKDTKDLN